MNIMMTSSGFTLNNITIYLTHTCIYFNRLILFYSFIGEFKNTDAPYMYGIEVEESTSVECGIAFSPIEVSSVFCYLCYRIQVGLQIRYCRNLLDTT